MRHVRFNDLKIQNFRVHENLDFSFATNKFVVVTGDNGAGKSSVFDALHWSLYDETTKGRRGDSVIRKRSGKNTFVELTFDIGDDFYTIRNYRKHKDFGDSKFLFKNGVNKENDISGATIKDTNQLIEQLIMPKNIFSNCLLFSQYMKQSFTEQTSGSQVTLIDKMMDVEKFAYHRETITNNIKVVKSSTSQTTNSIPVIESNIRNTKDVIGDENVSALRFEAAYKLRLNEINDQLNIAINQIGLLTPQLEKYIVVNESISRLNAKQSEYQTKIGILDNQFNQELAHLTQLTKQQFGLEEQNIQTKYSEELNVISSRVQAGNASLDKLKFQEETDISKMNAEVSESKSVIDNKYQIILDDLNNILSDINQDLKVNANELIESGKKKFQLEQKILITVNKLSEEIPICYTCNQPLDQAARLLIENDLIKNRNELININNLTIELSNLKQIKEEKQVENNHLRQKTITAKNEELSNLKSNWELRVSEVKIKTESLRLDIVSRINVIQSEQTDIQGKILLETSEKKLLFQQEGAKKAGILRSNLEKDKNEFNTKILAVSGEINNLRSELSVLEEDKRNYTQYVTKQQMLNDELLNLEPQYNNSISDSNKRLVRNNKILTDLELELVEKKKSLESVERHLSILEFWKKSFSDTGIKAILMDEIIPFLNEKARELSSLTSCIRVKFDSQTSLKGGDMRNKFSTNVIHTGNLTDDRSDFSGGEGRLVDIITLMSLRYALEKIQNVSFNILLLDEVLDTLDELNCELVLNMIRQMSANYCTVLITHTWKESIECDEHLPL